MKTRKHHVHLLMIAVIAVLAVSFLALNSIKILAEMDSSSMTTSTSTTTSSTSSASTTSTSATTAPPSCAYDCSSWSACSSSGTQTRTCKKSPDGCYEKDASPPASQSCAYTPPTCSYTYTEWIECSSAGMQYRDIKSYSPAGCVGGAVKELKRNCTYVSDQNSLTVSASGSDNTIKTEGNANTEINSSRGAETSNTSTNTTTDQSSQSADTITGIQTSPSVNTSWSTNDDWKKKYFGSNACPETSCSGDADPDKDRLSNNDEVRYGTDPLNPDADGDGKLDGDEVASGSNPLKYSKTEEEDKIIYESPKEAGEIKADIYKAENVELVDLGEGRKRIKISGKGPANSYVTVYIYSGQPVIITVKTDSNGDWTYTMDKELENGDHEVYVAVTNNSGAIQAKSEPLSFIKTAQAVTVVQKAQVSTVQPTAKTGISARNILFIFAFSFFGVVVAFILIGLAIKKAATKTKQQADERIDK